MKPYEFLLYKGKMNSWTMPREDLLIELGARKGILKASRRGRRASKKKIVGLETELEKWKTGTGGSATRPR